MKRRCKKISQAAYAKTKGVTVRAVAKAIQSGRLQGAWERDGQRYLIDAELADTLWIKNADPDRVGQVVKSDNQKEIPTAYGDFNETYNKARAEQKQYQAKLAKLEYDRRKGLLLEKDQVFAHLANVGSKIKSGLMNMPNRIMDKIAAEVDPYRCEFLLKQEINTILEELNDEISKCY